MNRRYHLDPLEPMDPYFCDPQPPKEPDRDAVGGCLSTLIAPILFVIIVAICSLIFAGCTAPRTVEEHHHHYYEADTAAVHALVDRQLTSWHQQMDSSWQHRIEEYTASWSSSESQKEVITELITVSTDSVGRTIRQEQRTISRDITRELQQQEQRITQEMQAQLRLVVDSVNDVWQQRYDSLASHVSQLDSTMIKKTPVGDTRPWYQRWRDYIEETIIILLILTILWFSSELWLPLLKRFLKRLI